MEGIWPPNFGGMGGKVETLTPHISKTGGPGGSKFFCAVGGLRALKNKILASGPPVKGGPERNNFDFKKFFRNQSSDFNEIFSILGGHPYDTLCKIWREFDEGVLGEGLNLTPLNNARR